MFLKIILKFLKEEEEKRDFVCVHVHSSVYHSYSSVTKNDSEPTNIYSSQLTPLSIYLFIYDNDNVLNMLVLDTPYHYSFCTVSHHLFDIYHSLFPFSIPIIHHSLSHQIPWSLCQAALFCYCPI